MKSFLAGGDTAGRDVAAVLCTLLNHSADVGEESRKFAKAFKLSEVAKMRDLLQRSNAAEPPHQEGGASSSGAGKVCGASDVTKELQAVVDLAQITVDQGPRRVAARKKRAATNGVRRVKERGALLQDIAQGRARIDHAVSQKQSKLLAAAAE